MKKAIKIILRSVSGLIIFLIMLPLFVSIVLQIGFVQQYAVNTATEILSDIAGTRISISGVALDFFTKARFEDVYVEDYSGDTMIYVKTLSADIDDINFLSGAIALDEVLLNEGKVRLYKDSTGVMNLTAVFANFKSEKPNPNPPDFSLTADALNLKNVDFTMTEYGIEETDGKLNVKDLGFRGIDFEARDISVFNYNIWMTLKNLSFEDKSGLKLDRLSSPRLGVDSSGLYIADVELVSGKTDLKLDSLNFRTANNTWWDWESFEENMILSARIRKSKLSTETLDKIVGLGMSREEIISIGKINILGAVANMTGNLKNINFAGNQLWADFSLEDITNREKANFDINIARLRTSEKSLSGVIGAFGGADFNPNDKKIISNLGELTLSSHIKGNRNAINTSLLVTSSTSGEIGATCNMKRTGTKAVVISGGVATNSFNLGNALGVEKLKNTTFTGNYLLDLKPNTPIVFDAEINVDSLGYGTYNYKDIVVDGDFSQGQFKGLVGCNDENFNMNVNGHFDYRDAVPQYSVNAELNRCDLVAIHLNERDSVSMLSAKFEAAGSGASLDEFNGKGKIDQIYYINHEDTIKTSAISISAVASPTFREINLSSLFADVKLRGRNSFNEIFQYFSESLERFLPSFPEVSSIVTQDSKYQAKSNKKLTQDTSFPYSDGYYLFTVKVKEANNVASIFVPTLEIASGTSVNFFFNPYLDQFTLRAQSDFITSKDFLVSDLNIDSRNIVDSLSLYTTAKMFAVGENFFPNVAILGGIKDNVISLGAQYRDKGNKNSALINTTTSFVRLDNGNAQMQVAIHPTAVTFDSSQWSIAESKILLDSTAISVNNLSVYNKHQRFDLNGRVGKKDTDTLSLFMQEASLKPLTMLVEDMGYNVGGTASGNVTVVALRGEPKMSAEVDFHDIIFGGHKLGDSKLYSTINNEKKRIEFDLKTDSISSPIYGNFDIPQRKLEMNIKFPKTPLSLLDPMLSGVISNTAGTAETDLVLTLKGSDVQLNGSINFDTFSTTIDYTKARYTIRDGKIDVKNSCFYLPKTNFDDSQSGSGQMWAELKTKSFKELTYDIGMTFTDLLALNTTIKDNSSFFGKAYGTGHVEVKGNGKKTSMNIVAQTARNSELTMPMSGASNIEEAKFITFVKSKSDSTKKRNINREYRRNIKERKEKESSSEIDMNMNITVLSNTLAQIELDAKVGDVIKGRGEGRLLMHINPTLDIFEMTGPVRLTEGNYLFTLQTIINKRFVVEPGSQLTWTGDPTNPEVDLTALYKLKTSLTPLTGDIGSNTKANIDCGILLEGKMLSPDISFSVTAPSADAEIQNALRNALNTQEALSMQFLSLLLSNSFMPDMGTASIGTMGSNMAEITGIEFLSNQLSNLISTEKFDIRIGYTPMSETTSDEFSAGVGTDLIEDVLSLEVDGNYNAQNNSVNDSQNPFSVDAYLTWNINKSGTLKLKGFTRTIDRFDETQGMQESGVGVYFTQDFNNFKDLKARLDKSFKVDSAAKVKQRKKLEAKKVKRMNAREIKRAERKLKKEAAKKEEEAVENEN